MQKKVKSNSLSSYNWNKSHTIFIISALGLMLLVLILKEAGFVGNEASIFLGPILLIILGIIILILSIISLIHTIQIPRKLEDYEKTLEKRYGGKLYRFDYLKFRIFYFPFYSNIKINSTIITLILFLISTRLLFIGFNLLFS